MSPPSSHPHQYGDSGRGVPQGLGSAGGRSRTSPGGQHNSSRAAHPIHTQKCRPGDRVKHLGTGRGIPALCCPPGPLAGCRDTPRLSIWGQASPKCPHQDTPSLRPLSCPGPPHWGWAPALVQLSLPSWGVAALTSIKLASLHQLKTSLAMILYLCLHSRYQSQSIRPSIWPIPAGPPQEYMESETDVGVRFCSWPKSTSSCFTYYLLICLCDIMSSISRCYEYEKHSGCIKPWGNFFQAWGIFITPCGIIRK